MSADSDYVPRLWKVANVMPVFEKGDRSLTSNYRPFSLTSVVEKMIVNDPKNVRDHVRKHSLIHSMSSQRVDLAS